MPQPPPANFHALPRMQIPAELATVLYYSRYPQFIPAGATIPTAHMHAADIFASAAYSSLARNPEQYTREPPPPPYRVPQILVPGPLAPGLYEEKKTTKTETEACVTNGHIPDAVTGAVTTNDNDDDGNADGGNAATAAPIPATSIPTIPTIVGAQPTAAVANGNDNAAAAASNDGDDIYNDYAQPSAPSPIELRINTGVTVSQSDNLVVLSTNPADVAGAVASAVMSAIEQASSARVGIPMIDESGVPRPLRVRVDASIRVGGSGNVLGPEALVRECLQARAAANGGSSQASQNLKRAREEEEVLVGDDDGESIGSKRSRSV